MEKQKKVMFVILVVMPAAGGGAGVVKYKKKSEADAYYEDCINKIRVYEKEGVGETRDIGGGILGNNQIEMLLCVSKSFVFFYEKNDPSKAASLAHIGGEVLEKTYKDHQMLLVDGWKWSGGRIYGSIKNDGIKTVKYYLIRAFMTDEKGNVINTFWTNNLTSMRPGMAEKFEINIEKSHLYTKTWLEIEEVRLAD